MKGLLAVFVVILLIGTAVNAGLLWQTNSDLGDATSELAALESTNSSLQSSVSQQQAEAVSLRSELNSLQTAVSQLGNPTQPAADFTSVARQVEPVSVYIEVFGRFGGGTGSGTIIRSDGYVLTNEHVIEGATSIDVTIMSGDTFSATIVNSNADLDLAVLKMDTTRTDFPTATLGSSAAVEIGEEIITCGFPLGSDLFPASFGPATFNAGIVSAIRNLNSANTENPAVKIDYIQIDADINPGNSGGGLFNRNAELIGVPAYGYGVGVNTAIPIDAARDLIQSAFAG